MNGQEVGEDGETGFGSTGPGSYDRDLTQEVSGKSDGIGGTHDASQGMRQGQHFRCNSSSNFISLFFH